MKKLKFLAILSLCFGIAGPSIAQELNVTVHLDYSQINNASYNDLNRLAGKIQSYLNEYSWTNDTFMPYERINATMQITLISASNNHTLSANIVIRSLRPIYHTNRQTSVFLVHDKSWTFHYTPNGDIVHDELRFDDIATLLDFYAYIIIGYDYDSFSPLGGTPYFLKAQHLVSLAQSSSSPGWSRTGSNQRNRAKLVSYLLDNSYQPLRRACYIYYRKGLDLFLKNPAKARQNIIKSLHMVQKSKRQSSNTLLFDIFFNTKAHELTSIFKDAPTNLRLQAFNLLSDLDPSHLSIYRKLQ